MACDLSLIKSLLLILLVFLTNLFHIDAREADDPRLIDSLIRDRVLRFFAKHRRTGVIYNVSAELPQSLSGVTIDAVRYRASSLRRHGAEIKEFRLAPGVKIHPHIKRLIVVRQNLGTLSSMYNAYRNLSSLRLISPVLGFLVYEAQKLRNASRKHLDDDFFVMKIGISVDFSQIVRLSPGMMPLCALFELDGTVSLSNQTSSNACAAQQQGHFALVIGKDSNGCDGAKGSGWKIILASTIACVFGLSLLGLILVAVINVKKKRSLVTEMERRAYESEALRVSMIGHVRAPMAAVTRTAPTIEDEYSPSL